MRILFVLSYYHPYVGGAESAFKGLAEELARRGHQVRVVTAQLPGSRRTDCMNGVEIERVPVPGHGDRYFFSALAVPALARTARRYDLVHTASNHLAPATLAVATLARLPVVFTCHEVIGPRWTIVESTPLMAVGYRVIEHLNVKLPYAHHVAVSGATRQDLLRLGIRDDRITVIYNGIDERFRNPPPPDSGLRDRSGVSASDYFYVFFGRPGKTKGLAYLLRAAPAIQRAIPNAHLGLILAKSPQGPYREAMQLIEGLGPGLNIHVHPPVRGPDQLARYLRDANCVVIPSLTEGFGLTTAETSALGVPIVATRVGAIPEVISGPHVLVAPASADALADGVIRAARGEFDPPGTARSFSWERMAHDYERLYERVLARCA